MGAQRQKERREKQTEYKDTVVRGKHELQRLRQIAHSGERHRGSESQKGDGSSKEEGKDGQAAAVIPLYGLLNPYLYKELKHILGTHA